MLIFCHKLSKFLNVLRRLCQIIILTICNVKVNFNSWKECLLVGLLLEWFVGNSECSDCVYIDQNWKDMNFLKVMNLWQIFYFSILREHATSIKICTISYDASLVDVAISSSVPISELWYHLYLSFEFSTHTVRSRGVNKNLCTIECSIDHRIVWNPTFLANFVCHWSIIKLNDKDSNGDLSLPCNVLDSLWKFEISHTSFTFPRCELSCLKVIVSISKDHFGSDSDDFVIVHQDSCIIESCFV